TMEEVKTRKKIVSVFGTRPEAIKMVPILRELGRRPGEFESVVINTAQHTDLLQPLLDYFEAHIDHDLGVLRPGQSLDQLLARLLQALDPILDDVGPDAILVQGDTTSALAGALAAHHRQVPVAHIEAGLRSGNRFSPFPEEMNRRLITQLTSFHMAATQMNVENLHHDGVAAEQIFLTGNPVVDAMNSVLADIAVSAPVKKLIDSLEGKRLLVLTTHRRESFGDVMSGNMRVLRDFVQAHPDMALVFPVHPNPHVRAECDAIFQHGSQIHLVDPMIYPDFLHLLSKAWLIVSDSGGVQEEAPTLGKALLVLRENTERPEVLACGAGKLVGGDPKVLACMLDEIAADQSWLNAVKQIENPFGQGDAAERIVDALFKVLR
ncbi:MAG: UDP-N-acetylglucosamine 2-epimerase (non-hydrolyzing), partial [Pseudomonadota bacterium]